MRIKSSGARTMSSARWRGFSDEYGSWNTSCSRRRLCRNEAPPRAVRSVPSKRMEPAVGSANRSTDSAVVVLPEPDSPTIANVRPRARSNDTPSTALTMPLRVKKCVFRPCT
ncbi:hypothetical protein G6F54_014175 [Rhizopus delemar]|nr:hypothetical protein G6F54_014175 [Rhizopus delemar]